MYKEFEISIPPVDLTKAEEVKRELAKAIGIKAEEIYDFRILRFSIDARKLPCFRLKVSISDKPVVKDFMHIANYQNVRGKQPVVIVGAGPAGLFAALRLLEHGLKPVIIEKGQAVEQRKIDIAKIVKSQTINPKSNWCFGEGGAGTFSDGKLFSRSNKRGNITQVLETFVRHGAYPSILYDSHPHIGTDNLSRIIKNIRMTIEDYGGEYHFDTTMTDIVTKGNGVRGIKTESGETIDCRNIILACGHSSREVYAMLKEKGWEMESKPFAAGIRIEHSQEHINQIQYHRADYNPLLPAASYQLSFTGNEGGVFSFCMCPGGIVIPASTSYGQSVVNGMSNSSRKSPFANAGIVVSVNQNDVAAFYNDRIPIDDPLLLMKFQQDIEQKAFAGKVHAYSQRLTDFLTDRPSSTLNPSSYLGGLICENLNEILPKFISRRLKEGFVHFNRKMKGFITQEANLIGIESRTSSPVRIIRNPLTMQHVRISGLYPCGEGAGYAGGITSSAIDGINVADSIAKIT